MPPTMKSATGQPARPARSCSQGRESRVESAVQAMLTRSAIVNFVRTDRYGRRHARAATGWSVFDAGLVAIASATCTTRGSKSAG
jgi:hypothetical protein